ncbi:swr1 complex component [Podila epigama]|nr:swr1 complex component [Podila epigama]
MHITSSALLFGLMIAFAVLRVDSLPLDINLDVAIGDDVKDAADEQKEVAASCSPHAQDIDLGVHLGLPSAFFMASEFDPDAMPIATPEQTRDPELKDSSTSASANESPASQGDELSITPKTEAMDDSTTVDPSLQTSASSASSSSSTPDIKVQSTDQTIKSEQLPSTISPTAALGQPEEDQLLVAPPAPLKRGPGRPPRSLVINRPVVVPQTVPTSRPRRTQRIVTNTSTTTTTTTQVESPTVVAAAVQTTHSTDAQSRVSGQRTSTWKFLDPPSVPAASSSSSRAVSASTRATPANQRPLLTQQRPVPETITKRGPGRPPNNPQVLHIQRAAAVQAPVSPPPPPPPPPTVPVKRGPGRPPRVPLEINAHPRAPLAANPRPRKPLAVNPPPRVALVVVNPKSRSAPPTMVRTQNQEKSSPNSSPRSACSSPGTSRQVQVFSPPTIKRGPGRPKRSDSSPTTAPSSPSPWRHNHTLSAVPSTSQGTSRSHKRHLASEGDEAEAISSMSSSDSGFSPRKRRVLSFSEQATAAPKPTRAPLPEPRLLTPLDRARDALIKEWEKKLHNVIDHHDTLTRELFHLEFTGNSLTYDPVKNKADHSEPMLRFLRNYDLRSQVPDLVSTVQVSTDRVSTRRSAHEKREQLVDMLQRNVDGALPMRPDMASVRENDFLRRQTPDKNNSQFSSFGDFLDSFVYDEDEEITSEEAERRLGEKAKVMEKIEKFKASGRYDIANRERIAPFVDPSVPKLHKNWLMEHIMTSSKLIKEEGKLHMKRAQKVGRMIEKYHALKDGESERLQKLEEKRVRRLARATALEVKSKWDFVEKIVRAKHQALIKQKEDEVRRKRLNRILKHTTQILEAQQNTLSVGTSETQSSPSSSQIVSVASPSSTSANTSEVASEVDATSRRSSLAPSITPSAPSPRPDIDTGDDAEFTAVEMEADDEATLDQEESGSEDDDEELRGLENEMDIPIEELLKQYGYQLSDNEESGSDHEDSDVEEDEVTAETGTNDTEMSVDNDVEQAKDVSTSVGDIDMESLPNSQEMVQDADEKVQAEPSSSSSSEVPVVDGEDAGATDMSLDQERDNNVLDVSSIVDAIPERIKAVNNPYSTAKKYRPVKRRRVGLSDLYRGPPLPYDPYDEQDDERTIEEDEQEEDSATESAEISMLMREKDMSILNLLDQISYELSSSEYSDSYYDSDSEYEGSVIGSPLRIKPADPRYVVTLQDVGTSRKFPTRPNSELTDTDTEYDDKRTISIYGTDDELSLGDKLPLLDPIVQYESRSDEEEHNQENMSMDVDDRESGPEEREEGDDEDEMEDRVDTTATGANVKTKIPFLLRQQLREYQHVGLDWLANLYKNGLNGILADEMGLGKTMQTIALLAHLACEYGVWGPHLIVVPTSVMLNWEMEFKKWCPGFKILTYYGNPKERLKKRQGWATDNTFHVCITSYQLVLIDHTPFRRKQWHYLILDEAHNIKNFRSQRWQKLLHFNSARRLLLTGTPLQNNLMELWSLLYFLMPNGTSEAMPQGFANLKEFQDWFSQPVDKVIEGNGSEEQGAEAKAAVARLHTVLRPYVLRRLKADVEKQMPAKYEHIVYCRLSQRQRFLYDDYMSRAQTKESLSSGNFMSILGCVMQLRKVCNHPDLFEERPIKTSFAMPPATASFEITEFLVRRKMFNEIDKAREAANLTFLGLVFTGEDGAMSRMDVNSLKNLSASSLFSKKVHSFNIPHAKTLQSSSQYQDLRQYSSMRFHNLQRTTQQRWKQLQYVNRNRCNRQILYGNSLVDMIRTPTRMRVGCSNVPDQAADPRQYFRYTDALAKAIVSSEERLERSHEELKRFAFVTPQILVRTDKWSPLFINASPSNLEVALERSKEVFHPIESCLRVQFPDKRLLQFDCGKLQKLDSLLRELKTGGHRVLIFTQMTKVLDILEIFLNIHGHRYLRLDGTTSVEDRQHLTDRFNSDPKILAFILSTRSGGVGINLTGADTVIFYDSDWNPSMDRQCQDRCHRIGQTREVHIYRFVSEFTIEENMLKKANHKRMLDNVVIQEGGFTTDFFQKMDWRDMLGEAELAKIGDLGPRKANGEPTDLSTMRGVDLEQALAAAEDESDAAALRNAQHELEDVDAVDFPEARASAGPSGEANGEALTIAPRRPQTVTVGGTAAGVRGGGMSIVNDNGGLHPVHQQWVVREEGDETIIEVGHVDEYMLRCSEREYGEYVGFGGLPEPPMKDDDSEEEE